MRNNEEFSGNIDSTRTLRDVNNVEKVYYDKDDKKVNSRNYYGDMAIVYERPGFSSEESRLDDRVDKLNETKANQEDLLIFNLSRLYRKKMKDTYPKY